MARQFWSAAQVGVDFTSLVFVDEISTNTAMTRTHGWGQNGKKRIAKAPHGHWMTSTFPVGLTHDAILAPQLLPCPVTGVLCPQWLQECLIARDEAGQHRRYRQSASP